MREFKFKAWNRETKLLMRLNQIDCDKGVLMMKDHILLQYCGLKDKNGVEVYEGDILLFGIEKIMVKWNDQKFAWSLVGENNKDGKPFNALEVRASIKLCSYYESPESFNE